MTARPRVDGEVEVAVRPERGWDRVGKGVGGGRWERFLRRGVLGWFFRGDGTYLFPMCDWSVCSNLRRRIPGLGIPW